MGKALRRVKNRLDEVEELFSIDCCSCSKPALRFYHHVPFNA
jgi:hypothetical protein